MSRFHLPNDWYPGGIPANVQVGPHVYIDTSYAFAGCSELAPAVVLQEASGVYDRSSFIVGPRGSVHVGKFTCLNATTIVCHNRVDIGDHCLLAWGVVVTDCWSESPISSEDRRAALQQIASDSARVFRSESDAQSVTIEDNVWVGFDSVILPGVRLGRGCVVGCKTVIASDVPPYAVVVGSPVRIVRYLDPDDTPEAILAAKQHCLRESSGAV